MPLLGILRREIVDLRGEQSKRKYVVYSMLTSEGDWRATKCGQHVGPAQMRTLTPLLTSSHRPNLVLTTILPRASSPMFAQTYLTCPARYRSRIDDRMPRNGKTVLAARITTKNGCL